MSTWRKSFAACALACAAGSVWAAGTPKHWYKFDGNLVAEAGTTALSIGGENAASYVLSQFGQAYSTVTGSSHPYGGNLQLGDGAYSVFCSLRSVSTEKAILWGLGSNQQSLCLFSGGGNKVFVGTLSGANAQIVAVTDKVEVPDAALTYNAYAIVVDGNAVKFYVNGEKKSEGTTSVRPSGNFQWGGLYGGTSGTDVTRVSGVGFDDWRVYQGALSDEDVTALANEFKPWPQIYRVSESKTINRSEITKTGVMFVREGESEVTVTICLSESELAAIAKLPQGGIFSSRALDGLSVWTENVKLAFDNVPKDCVVWTEDDAACLTKSVPNTISIKTGPRTATEGYVDSSFASVGGYPVAGVLWNNTVVWPHNQPVNGAGCNDVIKVKDGSNVTLDTTFAFYANNTYYSNNSNHRANGNAALTRSYFDDGDIAAATQWAVTPRAADSGLSAVTLPAAPNARGWQLRVAGIPYEMYDLYVYVASDQGTIENNTLKACSIALSVDNGANWQYYAGDPANNATIVGTASSTWKANPYSTGTLTEGTNYIKVRVSKSAFGAESVSTIDITHAPRNTGTNTRSGLAGIQIVEVASDGIYKKQATGGWLAENAWTTSSGDETTWQNPTGDAVAYANINADVANAIELDGDVTATSVKVTSTADRNFTFTGTGTLTAPVDFTGYVGTIKNPTFNLVGTMTFGANSYLELNAPDVEKPYEPDRFYSVAGSPIHKTGDGTLKLTQTGSNDMVIDAGKLEIANATDITANALLTGAGGFVKSGTGTLTLGAANDYMGLTEVKEGTLKLGRGGFSFWNQDARAVTVATGATLDVNGIEGYKVDITLGEGATWKNGGAELGDGKAQAHGLTLNGNATVTTATAFGLLANGWTATALALNGHTLRKTGKGKFLLSNTVVTGGGTLDIQEGTVMQHGDTFDLDANDVSINLGPNGTFKVSRWFKAKEITGSGTLDVSVARMTDGLPLAAGSSVHVKFQVREEHDADITIPCGAGVPRSVSFYYADGSPCTSVRATIANGNIHFSYDASAAQTITYPNPVTGDDVTFKWFFAGTQANNDWQTIPNWYSLSEAGAWTVSTTLFPQKPNSGNNWEPVVIDGQSVATSAKIEGWDLKLGLFNGATAVLQTRKLAGTSAVYVDETSQLTFTDVSGANMGGKVSFYVAAPQGVILPDMAGMNSRDLASFDLYFKGEGTMVINGSLYGKDHAVKTVKLVVGTKREGYRYGRVTRKLISYTAREGAPTFDLSGVAVSFADSELTPTAVTRRPTGKSDYRLYQTADGVYLQYVGYAADAEQLPLVITIQ